MNLRKHITVQMTNSWRNNAPAWDYATTFRGTPRQCMAEYAEFKRKGGACLTAIRCISGEDLQEIRDALDYATSGAAVCDGVATLQEEEGGE